MGTLNGLPPDAVVLSATLELYQIVNRDQAGRQAYTVWVDAVTGNWQELNVTWNNDPGSAHQGDPPTTVLGDPYYIPWDVTQIVQGWVGGTLDNYGLHMRGDRSTIAEHVFYSRENGDYPPRLIVHYDSGQITPTPSPTPTDSPTPTPTPTLPGSGSCPGTVWVYPDRDTLVYARYPDTVYGDSHWLLLNRDAEEPNFFHANTFLHFPIDVMVPPDQHVYEATLHLHVLETQGNADLPWWAIVYGLDGPFDETTTNWSNQPNMDYLDCVEGAADVSPGNSWHTIGVTRMVQRWHE
ncbi:MAG: DNRLRE domain-containing protein [Chloroflexia bacterium]|nr:DNRLRE domain-containing protein [Chloroflexia bacterium]